MHRRNFLREAATAVPVFAALAGRPRRGSAQELASAMNAQEMSLYVFLEQGVYLFDEKAHSLKPVVAGDHRAKAGTQAGVAKAPLSLVYVADLDKYRGGLPAETKTAWSNAHAGFIGQNVYLFAASEGLASWFRAFVDGPSVTQLLNLRPGQKVLYGQTVGYPA